MKTKKDIVDKNKLNYVFADTDETKYKFVTLCLDEKKQEKFYCLMNETQFKTIVKLDNYIDILLDYEDWELNLNHPKGGIRLERAYLSTGEEMELLEESQKVHGMLERVFNQMNVFQIW